ncbi:MAG: hypothetical protein C5B56_06705 [Proteobacteria bacterium]|nr:MAG: hypothetical protein C5B56_06705 [Pseudomonadota bacterium]
MRPDITIVLHRRIARATRVAVLAAVAAGAGAGAAPADCPELIERFNAAVAARQVAETKSIEAQIAADAVCGSRIVEVRRRRAGLQLSLAQALLGQGPPGTAVEQLLAEASEMLWQAGKALGDLRLSQRRYADATITFEDALETIKNRGKTPQEPDRAIVTQIFESATRARLLAAGPESRAVYVPAAKDHRDGSMGGSFSENIRGFRPKVVPLPIQFETASAKLSAVGESAAAELLAALRQQQPAQLTLVGHADERGGEAYNLDLSERRVKAVRAFLMEQGITAEITAIGKGKSEPLQSPSLSGLSREEKWALDRRVEWRRE